MEPKIGDKVYLPFFKPKWYNTGINCFKLDIFFDLYCGCKQKCLRCEQRQFRRRDRWTWHPAWYKSGNSYHTDLIRHDFRIRGIIFRAAKWSVIGWAFPWSRNAPDEYMSTWCKQHSDVRCLGNFKKKCCSVVKDYFLVGNGHQEGVTISGRSVEQRLQDMCPTRLK